MNFTRVILRVSRRTTFQAIKAGPITSALPVKVRTDIEQKWFSSATSNQRYYTTKIEDSTNFHVQDDDDFNSRVLHARIPIIVDFHAEWCAPCKMLGPRLESEVDKHGGKVMLAKVDIDEIATVAMKFKVKAVPTVMLFKDGEPVSSFEGNIEDDKLEKFVKDCLQEKK